EHMALRIGLERYDARVGKSGLETNGIATVVRTDVENDSGTNPQLIDPRHVETTLIKPALLQGARNQAAELAILLRWVSDQPHIIDARAQKFDSIEQPLVRPTPSDSLQHLAGGPASHTVHLSSTILRRSRRCGQSIQHEHAVVRRLAYAAVALRAE